MKRMVISGAVLALAIGGMGVGSAAPAVYKVTGGGQIIDLATQSGAGDTIAFSAQSAGAEGEAAKGQFQYVDRIQDEETGKGTGKGQTVTHGSITCVVVYDPAGDEDGGMAVLGGETTEGVPFRVDVFDDGQGAGTLDLLRVSFGEDAQDGEDDDEGDTALCDEETEQAEAQLGRGNVKIHKAKS